MVHAARLLHSFYTAQRYSEPWKRWGYLPLIRVPNQNQTAATKPRLETYSNMSVTTLTEELQTPNNQQGQFLKLSYRRLVDVTEAQRTHREASSWRSGGSHLTNSANAAQLPSWLFNGNESDDLRQDGGACTCVLPYVACKQKATFYAYFYPAKTKQPNHKPQTTKNQSNQSFISLK